MSPQVTVIIVNWNRKDCVLTLLDSLHSQPCEGVELVVVDNASSDGSAEAIRKHPLSVTLLETGENLGGTGGFNAGIRYALKNLQQDYLWLLDNDAEVTAGTLQGMIEALESDPTIGVAGSCILSPEDHSLIVESGGFVDGASGTWRPHRRYERYDVSAAPADVEDVDYVPACSAVVRMDVVRQVGILDERFFLHWDDIDFCARVREAGYRVVAVPASPVYHGAEKGHSSVTLYYDFRNALLFFAKHARGAVRAACYARILSNFVTSMVYFALMGRRPQAVYLRQAIGHFLSGRFGRAAMAPGDLAVKTGEGGALCPVPEQCRRILVFAVGSYEEVAAAVAAVAAAAPRASLTVAVAAERAEAYRLPQVSDLLVFDLFRDGMRGRLATVGTLLCRRFDLGVSAGKGFTVPYSFLLTRNLVYDGRTGAFHRSDASLSGIWKVAVALVAGKLLAAALLLPALLAAGRVAKERAPREP